jgi:hypothetical protein
MQIFKPSIGFVESDRMLKVKFFMR